MKPLQTISWGCGVQSTTLAVMSALGYLPKIDLVITADTQWERAATYAIKEFYTDWLQRHGIAVETVTCGSVKLQGAEEHIHVPFWTETGAPLRRQCTENFKINVIKRRIREHLGLHPSDPPNPQPHSVEQWIGFSLDEWTRVRHSRVQFITNRWPLLEKRITRTDCVTFLQEQHLPIPVKSACIGCPYRAASEWHEIYLESPTEFYQAVEFDQQNRHNPLAERAGSTSDALYVYRHCTPLADSDLERDIRREKQGKQLPLICEEGYCHI